VRALIRLAVRLGPERSENLFVAFGRFIGPLTPEHRTAARNIAAAFPDKSAAERRRILSGCWRNFARVIVEFVFLDRLAAEYDPEHPTEGKVTITPETIDRFGKLRDDGKPAVIFAAHLANYEILAVVAAKYGLEMILPFRALANVALSGDVLERRRALMGRLVENDRGAAFEIAAGMERGEHLGTLVDQRLRRGLSVPFFGRPAKTNPMAAKFARQFDCPVHGARTVRYPDGRLHLELTPAIDMPRDGDGLIDVAAAMARINQIVEGWVREHPEQWFWLHNRWKR